MPSDTPEQPGFTPVDPYRLARNEAKAVEVKRIYDTVAVAEREGAFALLLDGREARTPARRPLALPTRAAADLVAAEWERQGPVMQPGLMAATRIANSVIDGVAQTMEAVQAEVVKYAGTDLLCYRADAPAELVRLQAAAWDPVLAIARERWDARLYLAEGVIHVAQPEHAIAAVERAVTAQVGQGPGAPFRLGALHVMTTLTGSALLGLAVLAGEIEAADAWRAAHVDGDFEISRWGEDAEAAERRERRWSEMEAAAAMARAVESGFTGEKLS